ncbi:restriction endonuclease subunit S [Collinsella tanakaei]|uniref:restriction endonuclease subunit S n=1 Tax=Collinsella tanakaei TaxID=626935 RepID=UPI002942D240|nr:restriction endonuclease subunit S [Collinsella tanakaei]
MADANVVPQIRFKGFTDPWEQRKLGELYRKNEERNDDGLGPESTLSVATMTYSTEGNGAAESSLPNYKRVRPGDIAFEGHTNKEFAFGRFVLNDAGQGIMSPRFSCLRPIVAQDFQFWKRHIHRESSMRRVLINSTKSGTMMNELVVEEFFDQSLPVPSLSEQRAIGALFSRLDSLITLHQRKCDKLSVVKKALLEKMFPKEGEVVPEIRFKGFTDPWEQRKLGDVATIVGGGTPSTNNSAYWDGDIDWYSPAELGEQVYADRSVRRITQAGYDSCSATLLPAGKTILFTSRAGIGHTAILRRSACTNQGFQSLVMNDGTDVYFVYSTTDRIKKFAERKASGSTFLEISGKGLAAGEFAFPSKDEQAAIGSMFKQLDSLITLHQRELETLKNVKKALLEKMFV